MPLTLIWMSAVPLKVDDPSRACSHVPRISVRAALLRRAEHGNAEAEKCQADDLADEIFKHDAPLKDVSRMRRWRLSVP